jgi:hypothetical protein
MFYAAAFGSRLWQGERVAFVSDAEVVFGRDEATGPEAVGGRYGK